MFDIVSTSEALFHRPQNTLAGFAFVYFRRNQ